MLSGYALGGFLPGVLFSFHLALFSARIVFWEVSFLVPCIGLPRVFFFSFCLATVVRESRLIRRASCRKFSLQSRYRKVRKQPGSICTFTHRTLYIAERWELLHINSSVEK